MKHIFGPVPSRRFGLSLGIDIIPNKVCTLDCIYCQIGKTTDLTLQRRPYVAVKPVITELKKILKPTLPPIASLSPCLSSGEAGAPLGREPKRVERIDCLTFSGCGEPTLNSNIGKMIFEIKKISNIPIVVITNGTLFYKKDVRKDLLDADIVAPSLDAVLNFKKINRPHKKLQINKIVNGISEFKKIFKGKLWLEVLIVKNFNDSPKELKSLKKAIKKINPDKIHLNTVVRPPSEMYAKMLDWKKLISIRNYFGKKCKIISYNKQHDAKSNKKNISKYILEVLKRRPMQVKDIQVVIGIDKKTILKELWLLERKKIVSHNNNWWTLNQVKIKR
ncbi:MAG: hypothetical protein A2539_02145 [Elusimicrobia bacterium RIFOXYD2_FULL_34_15]|nr:MAG: hypothetical protein A2539_02145 [Elusimicrobia bacterium RIFOXYD2_FULL_34_15]